MRAFSAAVASGSRNGDGFGGENLLAAVRIRVRSVAATISYGVGVAAQIFLQRMERVVALEAAKLAPRRCRFQLLLLWWPWGTRICRTAIV